MANSTVSIFIRFKRGGKRQTAAAAYAGKARLKPGIGRRNGKEFPCPPGIYWLRWYDGPKQVWKRVGPDPTDAVKAQMRQEAVLAGESVPVEAPKSVSRVTLTSAVEDFLAERSAQTDERGLKRWRWELELFQKVCGRTYLPEVSRADCFVYMKWFQDRKKKPRTVYNRMVGLGVFLKATKYTVDFVFSQRKDSGEIPDYSEKTVDRYATLDLKKFFAACDAEDRLRYLFFLDTGCREREVMFACQEDFMFEAKECVQKRQTCSVGGRPTGVKARSPLAWVASVEKTKRMKPTDKAILGMVSKSPGRNESKPRSGLETKLRSGGRALSFGAKAAWHGAG